MSVSLYECMCIYMNILLMKQIQYVCTVHILVRFTNPVPDERHQRQETQSKFKSVDSKTKRLYTIEEY
jgi:hypothetical protein